MTLCRSSISPEQKDMLAWIGMAILNVQMTEKVIRLVMTFVIPKMEEMTLKHCNLKGKRTQQDIGYFLTELHSGSILMITRRNPMVYFGYENTFRAQLVEIPGWSLIKAEGTGCCSQFSYGIYSRDQHRSSVFVGLIRSWQERNWARNWRR